MEVVNTVDVRSSPFDPVNVNVINFDPLDVNVTNSVLNIVSSGMDVNVINKVKVTQDPTDVLNVTSSEGDPVKVFIVDSFLPLRVKIVSNLGNPIDVLDQDGYVSLPFYHHVPFNYVENVMSVTGRALRENPDGTSVGNSLDVAIVAPTYVPKQDSSRDVDPGTRILSAGVVCPSWSSSGYRYLRTSPV